MKKFLKCFSVVLVLSLVGCAGGGVKYIKMTKLRPSEIDMSKYKTISIEDANDRVMKSPNFNLTITQGLGDTNEIITNELEVWILQDKQFVLLDRKQKAVSNTVRETALNQLGSSPKAKNIITPDILIYVKKETDDYQEKIEKEKEWKDKNGKMQQKYIVETYYKLALNFRIVDAQTQLLKNLTLYSEYEDREASYNRIPEREANYKQKIFMKCLDDIIKQFAKIFTIHNETVEVSFLTDELLLGTNEAVERYRIDQKESVVLFKTETMYKNLEPKVQAKSFYNLGIARVYVGDFENGIPIIEMAIKLMPNEQFYRLALEKAKQEKDLAERLKTQQK